MYNVVCNSVIHDPVLLFLQRVLQL